MALSDTSPAVQVLGVNKAFGPNQVLHGVDFTLAPGEIHGLAGANGAGKSTLMKILNGVHHPDGGRILVRGKELKFRSPLESREAGIAMVFQEFSLVGTMTVAQNIFLAQEPLGPHLLVDDRFCRKQAMELFADIGVEIDPRTTVSELSVGDQQVVEIAKALSRQPSVLILDEPTASLSHGEIQALFALLHRLRARGVSIIIVTHHLKEIMTICDRITVLRDGRVVMAEPLAGLELGAIIAAMVGNRAPSGDGPQASAQSGVKEGTPVVLEVRNLSVPGKVHNVSFSVRQGEVLGIAGVLGSGRTELLKAVYGWMERSGGEVLAGGRPVRIAHPADARALGISLVPENRRKDGIIAIQSVLDNVLLPVWGTYSTAGILRMNRGRRRVKELVDSLGIKTSGLDQPVGTLSGGNQQKAVIAKSIVGSCNVLLLDDPTVGVDIASKADIAKAIRDLALRGTAVVLVSSEFEELEALCDRVLILRKGQIAGELDRSCGDPITEAGLIAASQEEEVQPV